MNDWCFQVAGGQVLCCLFPFAPFPSWDAPMGTGPSVSSISFSWVCNPSWEGTGPRKRAEFQGPCEGQCGVVLNGLRPRGRMTDQCWLWGLGKSPLGGAVLSSAPGDKDGTPRRLCEESVTGQVEVTMTVAEMLSWKLPDLLLINLIVLRS